MSRFPYASPSTTEKKEGSTSWTIGGILWVFVVAILSIFAGNAIGKKDTRVEIYKQVCADRGYSEIVSIKGRMYCERTDATLTTVRIPVLPLK